MILVVANSGQTDEQVESFKDATIVRCGNDWEQKHEPANMSCQHHEKIRLPVESKHCCTISAVW